MHILGGLEIVEQMPHIRTCQACLTKTNMRGFTYIREDTVDIIGLIEALYVGCYCTIMSKVMAYIKGYFLVVYDHFSYWEVEDLISQPS